MKIKKCIIIFAAFALLLAGCGKTLEVEQTNTTMTIEYGDDFAFDVSDYFSFNKDVKEDDYVLDASKVNTKKVGNYKMTVTFNQGEKSESVYTIDVSVVDTVAPVVSNVNTESFPLGYIWTNTLDYDFSEYIEIDELDDYTLQTNYEKLGDVEVVTDEGIANYQAMMETYYTVTSDIMETTESTEATGSEAEETTPELTEGYYKASIYAEDASGNKSDSVNILVIYDTTAPVVSVNGIEVDPTAPEITVSSVDNVTAHDNFVGDYAADAITITAGEENVYTVSVGDKAGNFYEATWTVLKQTSSNPSGNSSNNSTSNSSGSYSEGGNYSENNRYWTEEELSMFPEAPFPDTDGIFDYQDGTYCYSYTPVDPADRSTETSLGELYFDLNWANNNMWVNGIDPATRTETFYYDISYVGRYRSGQKVLDLYKFKGDR